MAMCHQQILNVKMTVNLRPHGGGVRRRFLANLTIHLFCIKCKKFRPRSHKVRSTDHVKWPHLIKSLNDRQSYTDWTIALKRSAIDTNYSVYNMYNLEFWYRWPKVRSILWFLRCKSIRENWKASVLNENHSKHSNIGLQVELAIWIGKLRPVTLPHNPY